MICFLRDFSSVNDERQKCECKVREKCTDVVEHEGPMDQIAVRTEGIPCYNKAVRVIKPMNM